MLLGSPVRAISVTSLSARQQIVTAALFPNTHAHPSLLKALSGHDYANKRAIPMRCRYQVGKSVAVARCSNADSMRHVTSTRSPFSGHLAAHESLNHGKRSQATTQRLDTWPKLLLLFVPRRHITSLTASSDSAENIDTGEKFCLIS